MDNLIVELSNTPAGETLALALLSAMSHAIFAAISKSGTDPYFNRGAINIAYCLIATPFALFIFPWPSEELFQILPIVFLIYVFYEWLQAFSFTRGTFGVGYI